MHGVVAEQLGQICARAGLRGGGSVRGRGRAGAETSLELGELLAERRDLVGAGLGLLEVVDLAANAVDRRARVLGLLVRVAPLLELRAHAAGRGEAALHVAERDRREPEAARLALEHGALAGRPRRRADRSRTSAATARSWSGVTEAPAASPPPASAPERAAARSARVPRSLLAEPARGVAHGLVGAEERRRASCRPRGSGTARDRCTRRECAPRPRSDGASSAH